MDTFQITVCQVCLAPFPLTFQRCDAWVNICNQYTLRTLHFKTGLHPDLKCQRQIEIAMPALRGGGEGVGGGAGQAGATLLSSSSRCFYSNKQFPCAFIWDALWSGFAVMFFRSVRTPNIREHMMLSKWYHHLKYLLSKLNVLKCRYRYVSYNFPVARCPAEGRLLLDYLAPILGCPPLFIGTHVVPLPLFLLNYCVLGVGRTDNFFFFIHRFPRKIKSWCGSLDLEHTV